VETGEAERLAAAYPALREQILDFAGIGAGRLLRADAT